MSELKALRFFVGAFEAGYFPCIHYVLASWYKSHEIGRRGALFYMGQFLGVLTYGLITSTASDNLDGFRRLEGWKWLFLVDGIVTIMIAAIMALFFFLIPGTPMRCYSVFLSDEEIILAGRRIKKMDQMSQDVRNRFLIEVLVRKFLVRGDYTAEHTSNFGFSYQQYIIWKFSIVAKVFGDIFIG